MNKPGGKFKREGERGEERERDERERDERERDERERRGREMREGMKGTQTATPLLYTRRIRVSTE